MHVRLQVCDCMWFCVLLLCQDGGLLCPMGFFFFTACWLPVYLYIWFNVGVAQDDQGVPGYVAMFVYLFVSAGACNLTNYSMPNHGEW